MTDTPKKNISALVEVSLEIIVKDSDALDLTRGQAFKGQAFNSETELLEHLAINMYDGRPVNSLDGWADLDADAIVMRDQDASANIDIEVLA